MHIRISLILISLIMPLQANAFIGGWFKKTKNPYSPGLFESPRKPKQTLRTREESEKEAGLVFEQFLTKDKQSLKAKNKSNSIRTELNIVYISGAHLYPVPTKQETYLAPPQSSKVLYKESQVILQETVRDIIHMLKKMNIDLVIFGGDNIANTQYYDLFVDIGYELKKYQIESYSVLGIGELTGVKPDRRSLLAKFQNEPYRWLKLASSNIILLNNASEDIVPIHLPEEATEQYLWLKRILLNISELNEEVMIFSYKPLDWRTKDLIKKHPGIKVKVIASAQSTQFKAIHTTEFGKDTIILENPALSEYPCSYSLIQRLRDGSIKVTEKAISLKQLRAKAKSIKQSL